MFSNQNNSFGSSSSTLGFGTTSVANATPFGQTSLFGKTNIGGFSSTAPMFGTNTQPTTGSVFTNSTFGTTPQAPVFGSGLFNTNQHGGQFFQTPSTSAFGQINKTAGFGFGTPSTTIFGQQQASNFQPSVFGSTGGFSATTQMGTPIKFNPVTGTDTMQKNGLTQSINTKNMCITCMKDYETKSLEELRWEDYQANRKGPQKQSGFGAPFGAPASTAPSLFGQSETKPAFNQSTFGTNTSGFGLTSQASQSSLFPKSSTSFGNTPTSVSFGFNNSTFGSNATIKPFGAQSTSNVFGAAPTTQSTGFGNSFFPSTNTQPTLPFGQQSTSQPNFFQMSKPTTTFGNFGQTNTAAGSFGQPNSLFNSQVQQNPFSAFQKPQSTFGQPLQTSFGTQPTTNSFFGANKPLFGDQNSTFTNNTGFMMQQQPSMNLITGIEAHQQIQDFHELVYRVYEPYPHHECLDKIKSQIHESTNPNSLQEVLDAISMPVTPIEKSISKYRTLIKSKPSKLFTNNKPFSIDTLSKPSLSESNLIRPLSGKHLVINESQPRTDDELLEMYKGMTCSGNDDKNLFKKFPAVDSASSSNRILGALEGRQRKLSSNETYELNLIGNSTAESIQLRSPNNENKSTQPLYDLLKLHDDKLITDKLITPLILTPIKTISSKDKAMQSELSSEIIHEDAPVQCNTNTIEGLSIINEVDCEVSSTETPLHSTNVIDTCGVKLERSEYYTKPSLDELHKFKNDKGQCLVKGFTIGRTGYGSVYFPETFDVSNINIDEIVHFRFRELVIYPDDDKKPPAGQGLNRSAEVTLYHVWPLSKTTGMQIKDPKELTQTNFIERLCRLSEKQNARFVDYCIETGAWIFAVNHFSRYGFDDFELKLKIKEPKVEYCCINVDKLDLFIHLKRLLGNQKINDHFTMLFLNSSNHKEIDKLLINWLNDNIPSQNQQYDLNGYAKKYSLKNSWVVYEVGPDMFLFFQEPHETSNYY